MASSIPCPECGNNIHQPFTQCPHCGLPGHFWNVLAAQDEAERSALERRYQSARKESAAHGTEAQLTDFEAALNHSKAVIARSDEDVLPIIENDNRGYTTYYKLLESELRLPDGDKWDVLRQLADTALFPGYKQEIRFAALSLDGAGLSNYGNCSMVLRDKMIAHRASIFEENSVLFMKHHDIKISKADKLPKGYRATWAERAKLCIAKLSKRIDDRTGSGEYSGILLRQGTTGAEDEFVEVHIWGPITARTIEQVNVTSPIPRQRATRIKAANAKLK